MATERVARTMRVELHPDSGQWRAELWVDDERECYAKAFTYSPVEAVEALHPYMATVAAEELPHRWEIRGQSG